MNIPNSISLLRILLIPIIIILLLVPDNYSGLIKINNYQITFTWFAGGILFIIAGISDWVDGYLARKLQQVTNFGRFFDSIADKLLSNAVLIIFSSCEPIPIVPVWITLIFVLRDFLIDGIRQVLATKNYIMAANRYGKWKFSFYLVAMTILFFWSKKNFLVQKSAYFYQLLLIPLYIALILSIISAIIYIYQNWKLLKLALK